MEPESKEPAVPQSKAELETNMEVPPIPIPGALTIADLKGMLDDEKPPTDDKEDIGNDKDMAEYSLNSSFSEDEKEDPRTLAKGSSMVFAAPNPELAKTEKVKTPEPSPGDEMADLSLDEIEEVISNPYAEMPEFYPKQLDYDPILGLPGYQKQQMEHKRKTVLKDKYWGKLLKDVYDMATAKVARPVYLAKVLSLYILHQDKLVEKRREAAAAARDSNASKGISPNRSRSPTIVSTTAGKKTSASPRRTDAIISPANDRTPKSLSRKTSTTNPFAKYLPGAGQNSVANIEVQKRIERLEKGGCKLDMEELARESKNILVRMPPYKRGEGEAPDFAAHDTNFMRMLSDYAIDHGFIKKWKGEGMS